VIILVACGVDKVGVDTIPVLEVVDHVLGGTDVVDSCGGVRISLPLTLKIASFGNS
jgi:hypothetical protein